MQTPDMYIGTSGISIPLPQEEYPVEFKGTSRLHYYSNLLNSLEVNSSFYKNPRAATVIKWASEVPGNFRFTFKVPKAISHTKGLHYNEEDVSAFIHLINEVDAKHGCLLIQLPPSASIDLLPQLIRLFEAINIHNEDHSWKLAVEFRNTSWYTEEVYGELRAHDVCMVIHDYPKAITPLISTAGFFYYRFHGENGRYKGSYSHDELLFHAKQMKAWLNKGKQGYCYFNNTMGEAFNNAKTLENIVRAI